MWYWKSILFEMLEDIRISRLADNAEITLCTIGGKLTDDDIQPYVHRIVNTGKGFEEFEFPTLDLLYDELEEDSKVMYCHLKGVSQPHSVGHRAWRRDLVEFTIMDWKSRIIHLDVLHTSGPRVCTGGAGGGGEHVSANKHYSGNFWWANAAYLKTLPQPSKFRVIHNNRYAAESWIGQNSKINDFIL